MTKGIVISLMLAILLGTTVSLLPYRAEITFVPPGGVEERIVPIEVTIFENDAIAGLSKKAAKKFLKKLWNMFTSAGGAASPGYPNFGGIVTTSLKCKNGITAFMIAPVAGLPGPYGVVPTLPPLYLYSNVRPGVWVLGKAPLTGCCWLCKGPVCICFSVYLVGLPGMGTSK